MFTSQIDFKVTSSVGAQASSLLNSKAHANQHKWLNFTLKTVYSRQIDVFSYDKRRLRKNKNIERV